MKLWTGIVTEKLNESKDFYTRLFGCQLIYEAEWFVLLELGGSELGFMKPGLGFQAEVFQKPMQADHTGMWLTIDVEDAQAEYARLQQAGVPVAMELRDEPWGDRHFVVLDPNGIPVDLVQRIGE